MLKISHIRPVKNGKSHYKTYSFLTKAEQPGQIGQVIADLDQELETLYVWAGADLHTVVPEAIFYCKEYGVPGVIFEFNSTKLKVFEDSDLNEVIDTYHRIRGEDNT